MARLRTVKPKQAIQVFEKLGFKIDRRKGSHISMIKKGCIRPVVIPDHREIAIGTLKGNMRTAGIDLDEFERILQSL